jgi:hypothetical protein
MAFQKSICGYILQILLCMSSVVYLIELLLTWPQYPLSLPARLSTLEMPSKKPQISSGR